MSVTIINNTLFLKFGKNIQADEIAKLLATLSSPYPFIFTGVILAPIVEETFFRGFLFAGFRQRYGYQKAALLSSAIFAAAHLQLAVLVPTFVLGYIFSYLYQKSNSIIPRHDHAFSGQCLWHVYHFRINPIRAALFLGDQPHLAVVEKIIPGPVDQHHQPVAKTDDAENMQHHPDHPGNKAAERQAPDARHRRIAPDRRQQAGILVMECFGVPFP